MKKAFVTAFGTAIVLAITWLCQSIWGDWRVSLLIICVLSLLRLSMFQAVALSQGKRLWELDL